MDKTAEAVAHFSGGYACSQAVVAAQSERYGIPPELAVKMTSGFGAGMNNGSICGVVTGAYMILGLHYGGDDCTESTGRQKVYQAMAAFNESFIKRHGEIRCRNLLECDISTEQGLARAKERELFTNRCPGYVQTALEILDDHRM